MNFDKQINYLLHLNRDNFNVADRKIEKVLRDVFEKGRKLGAKEERKTIIRKIKI